MTTQPATENTSALTARIETAKRHIKALRKQLEQHEAALKAAETELIKMENDTFLTAHNAMHLQPGTRIAISKSFLELWQSRRYSVDMAYECYGHTTTISYIYPDDGTFGIAGYEGELSRGSIGGIPLNVIQDMYEAYQGGAA